MKILIVEDDYTSRRLLQRFLGSYGLCDIAVNGMEAVGAFERAFAEGRPYDLVCLDIMLPELDGQLVLKRLRDFETNQHVVASREAKIIMTTALNDGQNVVTAFKSLCNSYLVKPIDRSQLISRLREMKLIPDTAI